MNTQLKVDLLHNNKSKNSFGNSFSFNDEFETQNQFLYVNDGKIKNQKSKEKSGKIDQPDKIKSEEAFKKQTKKDKLSKQEAIQQQPVNFKKQKTNKKRNHSKIVEDEGLNQVIQIEQKQEKKYKKAIKPIFQKQDTHKIQPTKNKNISKHAQNQKSQEVNSQQSEEIFNNKIISSERTKYHQQKQQFIKESPLKYPRVQKVQKLKIDALDSYLNSNIQKNVQIDSQGTKISEIRNNILRLNNNLSDIKQNYLQIDNISAADQLFSRKNNITKQLQIREFLTKKRIEKQRRHKKIDQIRSKEQQKISKTIEVAQLQKKRVKQQKINRIKQKEYIEPRQRKKKHFQQQQERKRLAQLLVGKYKNHVPFHIRKQKQFQQVVNRKRQEQDQIMMERRERYRSLDLQQLSEHKRVHQQRLQEHENMKKQQRQGEWKKIQQDNNFMKDQIWKGASHDIMDEERVEMKRKRKQPKQKVKKMKNYYDYIKDNFLPKTHQPKRSSPVRSQRSSQLLSHAGRYHAALEDSAADQDPHRKQVRKYRFLQGRAIGEVVMSVPVALSSQQQKKVGWGYLQHLKSLPKKRQCSESTAEIDSRDLQMIYRKFNTISKVKRQSLPFYQNTNKKRTVSISQRPNKQQVKLVYQQLRNHDVKLRSKRQLIRAMKQDPTGSYDLDKQLNAQMVLNMERKLDLLTKL